MQGPLLLEPIGFAVDLRMLLGIRDRVNARAEAAAGRVCPPDRQMRNPPSAPRLGSM